MRMEEMSRRKRKMEASSKGGQGMEGAIVPQTDGWLFAITYSIN
jgi:hypothetical protein